jgi:hypothetical protein
MERREHEVRGSLLTIVAILAGIYAFMPTPTAEANLPAGCTLPWWCPFQDWTYCQQNMVCDPAPSGGGGSSLSDCEVCIQSVCLPRFRSDKRTCNLIPGPERAGCLAGAQRNYQECSVNCITDYPDCDL